MSRQWPSNYVVYDTETTGLNLDEEQILQFHAKRFDRDFNPLDGESLEVFVKPRLDVVPHPKAFLTHLIDISRLVKEGVTEWDLARQVSDFLLARPDTCIVTYNGISYDDELLRRLFYRTMLEPYDHEYRDGNRRFDVMRLVQLAYFVKPEILTWPKKEDGRPDMRLSALAGANGVASGRAHEAGADVDMTLGLLKLIKERSPELFDYAMLLTDKSKVKAAMLQQTPFLHISHHYGVERNYASVVSPFTMQRDNANGMITANLCGEIDVLYTLRDPKVLRHLKFTPREKLRREDPEVAADRIQMNKMPLVIPLPFLADNPRAAKTELAQAAAKLFPDAKAYDQVLEKVGTDAETVREKHTFLMHPKVKGAKEELQEALREAFIYEEKPCDPYSGLFQGFFSPEDRRARSQLHAPVSAERPDLPKIVSTNLYAWMRNRTDSHMKHFNLALRAKWNNFYRELIKQKPSMDVRGYPANELREFVEYLRDSLEGTGLRRCMTLEEARLAAQEIRLTETLNQEEDTVLTLLEKHYDDMESALKILSQLCDEHKDLVNDELKRSRLIQRVKECQAEAKEEYKAAYNEPEVAENEEPELDIANGM